MRRIPRQSRSRATVEAIVEAGRRLLIAEGYETLNVNTVADVAGVGIGSVYEYFGSKAELAVASADALVSQFEEDLIALSRVQECSLLVAVSKVVHRSAEACTVVVPLYTALAEDIGDDQGTTAIGRLEGAVREGFVNLLAWHEDTLVGDERRRAPPICARVVISLVGSADDLAAAAIPRAVLIAEALTLVGRYLRIDEASDAYDHPLRASNGA